MILQISTNPTPSNLPPDVLVWVWMVRDGETMAACGVVHAWRGRHTTHVASVQPPWQRRGIYSGIVLPALARKFGCVYRVTHSSARELLPLGERVTRPRLHHSPSSALLLSA